MGRVKGTNVKRMAKKLIERFPGQFGLNYKDNKAKLLAMGLKMKSKIEFNKLAGQITALVKRAAKRQKTEETTV